MNMTINSSSIELISRLHVLAKEHGAIFNFGFNSDSSEDFEWSEICDDKKIVKDLEKCCKDKKMDIDYIRSDYSKIWFEWYADKRYNQMVYVSNEISFIINNMDDLYGNVSDKTYQWLEDENQGYECGRGNNFYAYYLRPTYIIGFGYDEEAAKGKIKDHTKYVNRADNVVVYFYKLVVEYLESKGIKVDE